MKQSSHWLRGEDSFGKKARMTERIKGMLEATCAALQEETARTALLQPSDPSRSHFQFVKGEHHGRREATETVQGPTLRAWKRGGGYPIPLTHDRKATVSAVLAERVFIGFGGTWRLLIPG